MINQFNVLSSLNENEINNEENQDWDEMKVLRTQKKKGTKTQKIWIWTRFKKKEIQKNQKSPKRWPIR